MSNETENSRHIAAIDLGSNSFHMVVAKIVNNDLQLISKHKQRVHLASGLDDDRILSDEAIQRGLDCLAMFAERIQDFKEEDVRIAATHTLRQAINRNQFLSRAHQVIPYPIEVIPGVEEARLIYLGVAHTQPQAESMLVVDIGGGSTEIIIGQGFEPQLVNSLQMGCVSYTERFFNKGKLTEKNFYKASLAAEQKLENLSAQYKKRGWEKAFGSSGTAKAIREAIVGLGHDDGIITQDRLDSLIQACLKANNLNELDVKNLSDDRKPVFVAGLAIMHAVFKSLKIKEMHFSDGALREGLLYEVEDTFKYDDIRIRTTENLANKHYVDLAHAHNVKALASEFFVQSASQLNLPKRTTDELFSLLKWAALLHEVGLSMSLQGYHKHSAYILRYTNMPGFNSEQQLVISTLARFHRKALKLGEMNEFTIYKKKHIIQLIRILRLAVVLNGQRNDSPLPSVSIDISKDDEWSILCEDKDWLIDNKLLEADLNNEKGYWESAGWTLNIAHQPKPNTTEE
ncbi:exopolyphosphatase [Vibrio viridaestus]|uniref:Exopolyphosphatase n=1 Tax=Vibrio viridaestus TaxID=2487322 RepID=A0A3N9TFM7_9VIBR|nr:exopolyphosphatase [Vibrio viridaestus]RQW62275.1 exopolyphosphatase [Vibrio viridaestus]